MQRMKFTQRASFLALISIFSILLPTLGLAELPSLPSPSSITPAPPALKAKSYLLIDFLSDYVIAEQDVDQRVEPASLTKMMTVYVVDQIIKSGKLKLTDTAVISERAWRTQGSRMFVDLNSSVPVEELLRGIIIQSGNDASVALAEHVAGTEEQFAYLMNFSAKQLGMINTNFVNATGLPDPNHYTTARDMAILAKALIRDFPQTYAIYSQKEFTYKDIKQINRNRLLWRNASVDGIKTGHTDSAGYCLVASGQKENMRLIAVVMGTKSDSTRIDEANTLLNYGFRFFETRKFYPGKTVLKKSRIWMGNEREVNLGLAEDLYVTIGRGQYDRLQSAIQVDPVIKAPAPEGTALGIVAVHLNDKIITQRPIIALNDVKVGGFLSRAYDRVTLTLETIINKVMP